MNAVLRALARALPLLANRRVLLLVAAPLLGAIVLWLVVAIAFGAPLTRLLAAAIAHGLVAVGLNVDPGGFVLAGGAILAALALAGLRLGGSDVHGLSPEIRDLRFALR